MADSFLTTTDVTRFNDADLDVGLISDVLNDAPLLAAMAAKTIKGFTYKALRKTAAPVVGFRSANDGRDMSKTTRTLDTVTCSILDASFEVDVAVAQADERGEDAALADEGSEHLGAAFFAGETQIIDGSGDANGFDGFSQWLDNSDDSMVYDVGGTTEDTASSAWAIRTGMKDVIVVWGQNGEIALGDTSIIQASGDNGKYPAYYTPSTAWMGLQIGSSYSLGRACNITADSGKTLTDDVLAELYSLFPSGRPPTMFAMSRRSLKQLRASRTATSPSGAPAPFPRFWEGSGVNIPIIVTEAQVDTETLLTAAGT